MFALKFRAEVNRQETRVMGLSSSEDRMIVAVIYISQHCKTRTAVVKQTTVALFTSIAT